MQPSFSKGRRNSLGVGIAIGIGVGKLKTEGG